MLNQILILLVHLIGKLIVHGNMLIFQFLQQMCADCNI